ncbi:hypothetical protein DXN05_07085 [Deminuibacter soli]|uniref:Uncharacterized protein n=1 Tax=Deminuibacter soli TaxID=2291815 RepID=A0A3E1NL97_9BACT|nr:hypothetical protein DXN05_07085 [Deminuibacter soli]
MFKKAVGGKLVVIYTTLTKRILVYQLVIYPELSKVFENIFFKLRKLMIVPYICSEISSKTHVL